MKTFLLVWSPEHWPKEHVNRLVQELSSTGKTKEPWSCANGNARPGDRVFLIRLADKQRGIMASGYIDSFPFLGIHHSEDKKENQKVIIDFDFINPSAEPVITIQELQEHLASFKAWSPRQSGIQINDKITPDLEPIWSASKKQIVEDTSLLDANSTKFIEGKLLYNFSKKHERNPNARRLCLEHYGSTCNVCEINFEKKYGEIGKDFIHVHHLEKISSRNEIYQVDPINDLRPVCPNCHSMIHKKEPPFTIEEMKKLITNRPKF